MPRLGFASKLFLVVLVAFLLRLTPILLTGMPYDNDSWYIHYDVGILREHPDARILFDSRFDGYDSLWPFSVLIPYIITLIINKKTLLATHLIGPVLDAISVILFYTLALRYSRKFAWLATIILASSPGLVGIGVGLVKETIARPLFYATLLTVLRGGVVVSFILAIGLALTHHLTSFIAALIIVLSFPTAWLVRTIAGSITESPGKIESLIAVTVISAWLYFVGLRKLSPLGALLDLRLASLYLLALFSLLPLGLPLVGEKPGRLALWLPGSVIILIIANLGLKGVPPGVPPLGVSVVYYSAPYLILPYFVVYALSEIKKEPHRLSPVLPLTWLLAISGLIAYLVLGGVPLGQSPAGRLAVFLVPGTALLYAYSGRERALKTAALLIVVLAIFYVGALASSTDPESYDLAYHKYEYSTCSLLSRSIEGNNKVYADAKMRDLLYYLGIKKTVIPFPQPHKGVLVLYKQNLVYGYKLNSNMHGGDPKRIASLISKESLILNDGGSWIVWLHR